MEVVSIDGVEYVKASQIAKQFRYTSDYVGQLCRSGKIDAKLVGRTWYVNPHSLEGHKTNRYVKGLDEKTEILTNKKGVSRTDVEPVIRKETAKGMISVPEGSQQFLKRIVWQPVKYEHDTSELLPPLRAAAEPVSIPVDIADATKVRIKNASQDTILTTDSLPEVALTGTIAVDQIDDDFDNSEENIDITDIFQEEKVGQMTVAANHSVTQGPSRTVRQAESKRVAGRGKSEAAYTYPVKIHEVSKKAPALVVSSFAPQRVLEKEEEPKRSYVVALGSLFVLALLCGLGVVYVEKVVVVDASRVSTTYQVTAPVLSW